MPGSISTSRADRHWCWLALLLALMTVPYLAQAKSFHTDAVFPPCTSVCTDGPDDPDGGLVADAQGRLYGVSMYCGAVGSRGTVYRLTPGALKSDPWTTEVLHSFLGSDGAWPSGKLYIDAAGAVYGTTEITFPYGYGTVWRLDNLPGWPITILHAFGQQPDATTAMGGLLPGKDGLLYGNALYGGLNGVGAIFAISPLGDKVSYQVIHSFDSSVDGAFPISLTMQGDGAIYGISYFGSVYNFYDAVFRLAQSGGVWRDQLIYTPQMTNIASILNGPDGTLYLCRHSGKDGYAGQLSPPPAPGPWIENDFYRFERHVEGCSSLTINPSGGFVGVSFGGGELVDADGTLFSLTPSSPGGSAYTSHTLHRLSDYPLEENGQLLRVGGLYYGGLADGDGPGGEIFDVRP